jgi:acyl dehydratase
MMLELTVDQVADSTGLDLGETSWWTITQDRVNRFADATEDRQWIHIDPDRAAAGPFGMTIAHGYLTLSLLPAMVSELLHVRDRGRALNYGLDRVRFVEPVPVGGEVRLTASIAEASRRPDRGVRYRLALTMWLRDAERPAMVAESITLVYPQGEKHR